MVAIFLNNVTRYATLGKIVHTGYKNVSGTGSLWTQHDDSLTGRAFSIGPTEQIGAIGQSGHIDLHA